MTKNSFEMFYLFFFFDGRFGIKTSQICMVGDRLDTDVLFGQNGGCKTLLVLSGKFNHTTHLELTILALLILHRH